MVLIYVYIYEHVYHFFFYMKKYIVGTFEKPLVKELLSTNIGFVEKKKKKKKKMHIYIVYGY